MARRNPPGQEVGQLGPVIFNVFDEALDQITEVVVEDQADDGDADAGRRGDQGLADATHDRRGRRQIPNAQTSLNEAIMPAIVPSKPSSGEMVMIVRRPGR